MVFAGLGLMNAFCLLCGLGLGWLIDTALHTLPLFLMIGLCLGVIAGVCATRAELKRWG
jgi:F0F1-type ATP synthase assembly protein I